MANWFECKIKYSKVLESGIQKPVSESYLVDALSFTEAEARIIEEMTPFITGDFTVAAVKREKISDVFYDATGDKWYKVKTNFITIDEKTAVEKKTASFMLVQASEFRKALDTFMENMKDTLADFEIASIVETALMDVYPVDLSEKKKAAEKPIE